MRMCTHLLYCVMGRAVNSCYVFTSGRVSWDKMFKKFNFSHKPKQQNANLSVCDKSTTKSNSYTIISLGFQGFKQTWIQSSHNSLKICDKNQHVWNLTCYK